RAALGRPPLRPGPFDWRGLVAVLRIGTPIVIASVTELGIYLAATLCAATQGGADVAAHTLTLRTAGVIYAIPAALLQASVVRMARAQSLGDAGARRAVVASGLKVSLGFGLLLCLLLATIAAPLSSGFFDTSAAGIAAAETALGMLRGRKETRAPMLYALLGGRDAARSLAL